MIYDEKASCHGSGRFGKTPRQQAAIGAQHTSVVATRRKLCFSGQDIGIETPTYYRKAATRQNVILVNSHDQLLATGYRLLLHLRPNCPIYHFFFSFPSVPWQNGRNLFLDDPSNWILRLYSLKSILPRGSGIWQNGRILFEIPCQTGANSIILLWFFFESAANTHRPARRDESCFCLPAPAVLKHRPTIEKPLRG